MKNMIHLLLVSGRIKIYKLRSFWSTGQTTVVLFAEQGHIRAQLHKKRTQRSQERAKNGDNLVTQDAHCIFKMIQ
jgi:hypothetical protein